MSMQTDLIEHLESLTEDMKLRKEEEERETIEKEIYDINLELAINKSIYGVVMIAFAMCFLLLIRVIGKPVLRCIVYHETFEISGFLTVGLILVGILVVWMILILIYYKFKKNPAVKGSSLVYKDKRYHYSQISKIKISPIFWVTVFVDDKKLFCVTRDYMNCDAFVCWARKCRIPIEESEPLDEKDVEQITIWVVLGLIFLFVLVYFVGAILRNR